MINVTKQEFSELVGQYYRGETELTMKELFDNYNVVLDIKPSHKNDFINNLITKFCDDVEKGKDKILFKGLLPNNYLNFDKYLNENFKAHYPAFNGYREVYFSDKDLVIVSTVEGDIYISIFNSQDDYKKGYKDMVRFYEEN